MKTGIIVLVIGAVALGAGAWLFGAHYETYATPANFLCKIGAVLVIVGLISALIGWIMKRKRKRIYNNGMQVDSRASRH